MSVHRLKFLFAGLLVWAVASNATAADTYRVPETGNPALVAGAPPGWKGQYTAGNEMMLSSADDMAVLELSMISDSAMAAKSMPDVAAQVFDRADLPRWTGSEPDTLAGLPGQAFTTTLIRNGRPVAAVKVLIAKVDAGHIARVTEITVLKETAPAQLAELKELVSGLRIGGR